MISTRATSTCVRWGCAMVLAAALVACAASTPVETVASSPAAGTTPAGTRSAGTASPSSAPRPPGTYGPTGVDDERGCGTPLAATSPHVRGRTLTAALRSWSAMTGPADGSGTITTTLSVFDDGTTFARAPDGTDRTLQVDERVLGLLRHGSTKAGFHDLLACARRADPAPAPDGTLCAIADAAMEEVTVANDDRKLHTVTAYGLGTAQDCHQYPWALEATYEQLVALRTRVIQEGAPPESPTPTR